MRLMSARYLILLNVFISIASGDILDYGILGEAELEQGSIMEDSSDLFASDDSTSGKIFTDSAEDDDNTQFFISSANHCPSDLGEMPQIGKTRRGDVCHENGDGDHRINEQPFILPLTLLDAVTVKPEKYCPLEKFDEGSQYLVCSSGFPMDMLSYGLVYQALLNSELVNPIVLLYCNQPRELFCCRFFTTTNLEFYELPPRVRLIKEDFEQDLMCVRRCLLQLAARGRFNFDSRSEWLLENGARNV